MAAMVETQVAEEWKTKGNTFYKEKRYSDAAGAYTQAIVADPTNALLYTNRAAAYLMTQQYREALSDCDGAIRIDITCSKAYFRKATALKGLGRLDAAVDALNKGLEHDPSSTTAAQDRTVLLGAKDKIAAIRSLIQSKRYTVALTQTDAVIREIGAAFPEINILRAECLLNSGRPEEAFNLTNILMKGGHGSDTELLSLRAHCLLSMGDIENSFKHLQQAVRADPDNTSVRTFYRTLKEIVDNKSAGDEAFKRLNYAEAISSYSVSIQNLAKLNAGCDVFLSKLYLNRATSYHKLKRNSEAINDCNEAIDLNERYVKAFIRRAECRLAMGEPQNIEKAIEDLEAAKEIEDDETATRELAHKIKKAKVLLKRSKRKDLYSVLGLTAEASESEIKSAYRKAALRFHPDKQASKSDAEKAEAEAKFKEVGEAYEILTNPEKKARYDEGVDMEDLDNPHAGGCGHEGEMDPSMMFHMFMQQQQQQQQQQQRGRGGGGRGGFPGGFPGGFGGF